MTNNTHQGLRIGICGSASVGKTTLATALAHDLNLPVLREEMRDYLESTRINLSELPAEKASETLVSLFRSRTELETRTPAFAADNCSLDFAAYALYYGCLDADNAPILLSEASSYVAKYDAIFVLPWGVVPYAMDGVRPPSQYLQLRYQLIIDGLLRHHVDPKKLHFLPDNCKLLNDRRKWILSRLGLTQPLRVERKQTSDQNPVLLQSAKAMSPTTSFTRYETTRPYGSRILVARARPGASQIARELRTLGADVLEAPTVSTAPLDDYSQLDETITRLREFDAIVFGCAAGVSAVLSRMRLHGGKHLIPTIAIGVQAHRALEDANLSPEFSIPGSCSEALKANSAVLRKKKLLLVTSNEGRPGLQNDLKDYYASLEAVIAYRILHEFPLLKSPLDLVILPSSTAATLLLTSEYGSSLKNLPIIAIGARTELTARGHGACRITRSADDTIESVISAAVHHPSPPQSQINEPGEKVPSSLSSQTK